MLSMLKIQQFPVSWHALADPLKPLSFFNKESRSLQFSIARDFTLTVFDVDLIKTRGEVY